MKKELARIWTGVVTVAIGMWGILAAMLAGGGLLWLLWIGKTRHGLAADLSGITFVILTGGGLVYAGILVCRKLLKKSARK
jgi:hypothetical protein